MCLWSGRRSTEGLDVRKNNREKAENRLKLTRRNTRARG